MKAKVVKKSVGKVVEAEKASEMAVETEKEVKKVKQKNTLIL